MLRVYRLVTQALRGSSAHAFALLLILSVALVLLIYNLEYTPRAWFDEGWYLQLPKNLIEVGQYATRSSEGFRPYDTIVSVSPVFYLPFALAFKVGGVGLAPARIVVVAWFLLSCLLMYAITRKLYGSRPALIALALFVLVKADDGFTSALLLGRQAIAEIPSLCCFLGGMYLWLKSFDQKSNRLLIASGILFGLAMTIKPQFLLVVPLVIVALGVLDRLYYQQRRYRYFVLPLIGGLGMVLFQYAFVFLTLGSQNFSIYLSELFAASGPQVRLFFSPVAMQNGLRFFLRADYMIWVLPGIVWAVHLSASRDPDNIRRCMPWVFTAGWLAWFLIASIGWARYTFPALAVSYILVAKLIDDLASGDLLTETRAIAKIGTTPIARPVAVFLLLGLLLLNSSSDVVKAVFSTPDRSPQQFAEYLDTHLDANNLIETWEWEIAFLTNRLRYHHPPTVLLNSLIASVNLGIPYDRSSYDFQAQQPNYIVVGPFAKWTGLYPSDFLARQSTQVVSIGEYDLYRVNH